MGVFHVLVLESTFYQYWYKHTSETNKAGGLLALWGVVGDPRRWPDISRDGLMRLWVVLALVFLVVLGENLVEHQNQIYVTGRAIAANVSTPLYRNVATQW